MTDDGISPKRLLVGETWRVTAGAVLLAGALILVGSVVEYLTLSREIAGGETPVVYYVRPLFVVPEPSTIGLRPTPWAAVYGYLFAIALAAGHAYVNLGYLPSVLLSVSPNVGVALWIIHGFDEYVALTPMRVFGVLPEGTLVATVGFVLGVALRARLTPMSPSQPAERAKWER